MYIYIEREREGYVNAAVEPVTNQSQPSQTVQEVSVHFTDTGDGIIDNTHTHTIHMYTYYTNTHSIC